MSYLLIPKSPKVWEKSEAIGLGTFKPEMRCCNPREAVTFGSFFSVAIDKSEVWINHCNFMTRHYIWWLILTIWSSKLQYASHQVTTASWGKVTLAAIYEWWCRPIYLIHAILTLTKMSYLDKSHPNW